jgi:hypothetical protein
LAVLTMFVLFCCSGLIEEASDNFGSAGLDSQSSFHFERLMAGLLGQPGDQVRRQTTAQQPDVVGPSSPAPDVTGTHAPPFGAPPSADDPVPPAAAAEPRDEPAPDSRFASDAFQDGGDRFVPPPAAGDDDQQQRGDGGRARLLRAAFPVPDPAPPIPSRHRLLNHVRTDTYADFAGLSRPLLSQNQIRNIAAEVRGAHQ